MTGHSLPVSGIRRSRGVLGLPARLLLSVLVPFIFAGCAAKRDAYDVPDVALPSSFKNLPLAETSTVQTPSVATDPGQSPVLDRAEGKSVPSTVATVDWWRLFGNSELDALINRGLANSPDVRVATVQLAQAKARADQAKAGLLPSISMPMTVARQAPGGTVGSVPVGTSSRAPQTSLQGSLRSDFRLDVWGEQSALADSAQMQLWRAVFERDNVQRNVTASIAANYIEYLALNDRIRIAKESERTTGETLRAVERRLALGDATAGDLEQQKAMVFASRATLPGLLQQREEALNTLAYLLGTAPGNLTLSDQGLASLSAPEVMAGLPSSLLLRRPDIRMVEARLLAADADIDVARARLLPSVDLAAQAGYSSKVLSQFISPQTFFWSTAASLTASIFDGGRREGEKKINEAVHEEMVETYVRVIYQAMREVEGALSTIRLSGKRLDAQHEAAMAARRAWEINHKVYAMGGADLLSLLESERTFHRYHDDFQRAQMDSLRGYVTLFQAIGGGVQAKAPLPGQGRRPVLNAKAQPVAFTVDAPEKSFSSEGVDWQISGQRAVAASSDGEGFWQVELPGLYHRSTVGAVWRDLRQRYPNEMAGRMLQPRLHDRIEDSADGQEAWYRLYVAKFSKSSQAQAFCAQLARQQERCKVMPSRPDLLAEAEITLAPATPALAATPAVATMDTATLPAAGERNTLPEFPSVAVSTVTALPEPLLPVPIKPVGPMGYTLQIGAFAHPENAETVRALWEFRGYDVQVEATRGADGQAWYSVRTGQFADRSEAVVAQRHIRRKENVPTVLLSVPLSADSDGRTVAMLPTTSVPAAMPALSPQVDSSPSSAHTTASVPVVSPTARIVSLVRSQPLAQPKVYTVQLGAYSSIENAAKAYAQWQYRGFDPYVCETDDLRGQLRFAVRAGQFAQKREAEPLLRELRRQSGPRAVLLAAPLDPAGTVKKIDVSPLLTVPTLPVPLPVELSANDVR